MVVVTGRGGSGRDGRGTEIGRRSGRRVSRRVATAEAQAVTLVTDALKTSSDPATYLIAIKYLESLKEISSNAQKLVFMPYEASGIMSSLGGIKELLTSAGK